MKIKNLFKSVVTVALVACMAIGVSACDPNEPEPGPGPGIDPGNNPVTKVEISIGDTVSEVKTGDTVNLSVTVTGAEDTSYTWEYVEGEVIINNDVMVVLKETTVDQRITVTAVANADTTVKASKTFTLRAETIVGQVGDLKSEMIEEIGNKQIKASGVLTDVYENFKQSSQNSAHKYDFSVTMDDGAWSGSWNIQGSKNVLTDIYRRGDTECTNSNGISGHVINQMYIDKNNTVASKVVKDIYSVPAVWEEQHMWNHLGNLNVNTFKYDIDNDIYFHNVDVESNADLFLMTYLSYSLTPMLSDTLDSISFKVEDGRITKIMAQTEVLYYPEDAKPEDAESMSYTTLELTLSEIGTAVVSDPATFEAPEFADKLTAALAKMGNAENYTFNSVDTTTYSPVIDSDDYQWDAGTLSAPAANYKVSNSVSATGTVGSIGQVTKDAILIAKTIKYNASYDGKDYRTEYTGYRQFDGYYEEFAYDSSINEGAGALYGTKKVTGNMFDKMPTFDFSANIFKLDGMRHNEAGKWVYTFILRDTSITRDVAMEVSAYSYADNASASTQNTLTIVVDEDGNLVSTLFPYNINGGTYVGYVSTTYTKIGSTTLDEDLFDGYEARKIMTSWADASINYRPSHLTNVPDNLVSGDVVISAFFGDFASYVPSPELFINLFGDNLSQARHWADWKENGNDADGNKKYIDYISLNAQYMDYDENRRIKDWEGLADKIDEAMANEGFVVSKANTDKDGTRSASKNRYLTYTKTNSDGDGIMVVFENMGTSFIYISIYKAGDWQLSTRA